MHTGRLLTKHLEPNVSLFLLLLLTLLIQFSSTLGWSGEGRWTHIETQEKPLLHAQNSMKQVRFLPAKCSLAYVVPSQNGSSQVFYDGKPSKAYQEIAELSISKDGNRYGYYGREQEGWTAVVDGKSVQSSIKDKYYNGILFSLDGKHYGTLCRRDEAGWIWVFDGKTGSAYAGPAQLKLSDENGHFAFVADNGEKGDKRTSLVILDGNIVLKKSEPLSIFMNPFFNTTGDKLGFIQKTSFFDPESSALFDGKQIGPQLKSIIWAVLSPDGKHVAYCADIERNGKEKRLPFLDGLVSNLNYLTDTNHLRFSPDSQHFGYRAFTGSNEPEAFLIIVDGKPIGGPYEEARGPYFSLGSSKVAHYGKTKGEWIVIYGEETTHIQCTSLKEFSLTPDGIHWVCTVCDGVNWHLVVDGEQGPPFPSIFGVSCSEKGIRYLALKGNSTVVMEVKERAP